MNWKNIVYCGIIIFSFISCSKDLFDKSISITFYVVDESGKVGDCNIRIIKTVPWSEREDGSYNVEDVSSHLLNPAVENSYTFEDIEPGTYASIMGNNGEPYTEFTVNNGDDITINYTYYSYITTTIGNSYSGYYTMPLFKWKCELNK